MADFPGVVRAWMRGLASKIAASTATSTQHMLITDEQGNLYVGDGATQIKSLSPVAKLLTLLSYFKPRSVVHASGGDDTAAMQASLDAGGRVHWPDVLYKANGLVMSVAGTRLSGGGWQGGTVIQPFSSTDFILRVSANRVGVDDMDLNANSVANSCVVLHNGARSRFSRVKFYGALQDGARFDLDATTPHGNNNIIKFENCQASNNGGHGWAVPTRDGDNNGIHWDDCEGNSNTKSGLLYKGSGGRIVGGIWQANKGFGIELGEDGAEGATTGVGIYHTWLEANGQATNCAITSGSPNLSSSGTAAWASPRHVGTTVNVPGAGVAGAALVAKILTVTDATHVVLDTNASTTVSGVLVNSPNNGIRASTQSNGCELHIGAGQQGVVGNDTFGKVFTIVLGANGEYDVIGTASRGVRLYGRSGATAKAQVIAAGPEADIRLELLGKGASGAMLGASGGAVGFLGTTPSAKAAITGTRSDGAALAALLTELAAKGLVTDSSTAGTGGALISPNPVFKLTDTTFTSNNTLADDPDLQVAVAASSVYVMECYLPYEAGTPGDGLIKFVGPTGATMIWSSGSLASNATVSTSATDRNKKSITQQVVVGGVGTGTGVECRPVGLLTIGGTAGTFKLQTAQSTSDATSTIFYAGGWLRLTKVA